LAGVGYWAARTHRSKRGVIEQLTFGSSIDTIGYDGVQYTATWSDPQTFSGTVQWTGRASASSIPFLTHEVLVTTGDYSDPAIVHIKPVEDHHTTWTFPPGRNLQGTIFIVHCIPATPAIYDALDAVRVGETVEIEGDVAKGQIQSSRGGAWGTSNPTHPTVFVRDVRR
jgi:hypothetical protein